MQKSLRRFTQCGSLVMFVSVFMVIFSLGGTALTTFGINKPGVQPAAPTIAPKGKECATNSDCIGIHETSCVKDYDYKLRCLCGDFRAPNNGFCSAKMKAFVIIVSYCNVVINGLRHQCKNTNECEDYMICREKNSTKTTLGSFSKDKQQSNKDKLCFCDEENGYMENIIEKHCNAAVRNFVASMFGYVFAVIFYFAVTQKFLTY